MSPFALLTLVLVNPISGFIVLTGYLVTLALLFSFFNRTIGGMTGDTLGATAEIMEAVILVEGLILSRLLFL